MFYISFHSALLPKLFWLLLSNFNGNPFFCVAGVLLDDLLCAEDLAAAETTTAASHAAAAAAIANVQVGKSVGRYAFNDERSRQVVSDSVSDGSIMLGSPVAPPLNGDVYTDISTENAMLQVPR